MSDHKCSFCGSEEDGRKYLNSDDGQATVCSNCALMFAQYMLNQQQEDSTKSEGENDKNGLFQQYLQGLEDKWMEKNVINTFMLDAGGVLNEVHFRFEDEDDGYYFVCELEVENIDSLPDDIEENVYNEIEWAFDEIRDELEEQGLDLELYLGEKLVLQKVN